MTVRCTRRSLTDSDDTRCCTIWPPEDEQDIARNMYMYRTVINVFKICAPSWSLAKVILRWTVREILKTPTICLALSHTVVFWVKTWCINIYEYQSFGGKYCSHPQDTTLKTTITARTCRLFTSRWVVFRSRSRQSL